MRAIFRSFDQIREVVLFGSRAKGHFRPGSDVDLCLIGTFEDHLFAAKVALALDELPIPYLFDVKTRDEIRYPPLLEHIERVGVTLYQRDVHGALEPEDHDPRVREALWGLVPAYPAVVTEDVYRGTPEGRFTVGG
ncbi:MAG: nucleotidyltransferase domain-containing protein [Magnetococcales bacterium]|nr:nucleotidyltransferase domain-containing protein [Magnetococcales bacterium]